MKNTAFTVKLLTVLCLFSLLSGCGKVIESPGIFQKRLEPKKQLTSRTKIPPTQRPYKINGKTYYPIPSAYGYSNTGIASWYGKKFHGRKTSNGETYDMYGETAAHKTLPMNTRLLVENLENGSSTVIRINDRGPFVKERIIDLSYSTAQKLGMARKGTARVKITALGEAETSRQNGQESAHFLPYQDFNRGDFYIQVGAFTLKTNAERLKDKILSQGRKAVIQTYSDTKKTFYRVQVHGGNTLQRADMLEERLEIDYPGAFIIAR